MYAEAADVENVMVAGRWLKRDGTLTYDAGKLAQRPRRGHGRAPAHDARGQLRLSARAERAAAGDRV